MTETEVRITPLPMTGLIGCVIPVVPGTPNTDAPLDERSELCAVDANWIVGSAPTCDVHMKVVCETAGWDWLELLEEAGRDATNADRPWADRQRHSQDATQQHLVHFEYAQPTNGEVE